MPFLKRKLTPINILINHALAFLVKILWINEHKHKTILIGAEIRYSGKATTLGWLEYQESCSSCPAPVKFICLHLGHINFVYFPTTEQRKIQIILAFSFSL